jgi:hypothetical protein
VRTIPGTFVSRAAGALLATALAGCATHRSAGPLVPATAPTTGRETRALARFNEAMAGYVALRDDVRRADPSPVGLAARIRERRGHAKQGDVFRRAVAEELQDPEVQDTRRTMGEGNPGAARGVEQDGDIARRQVTLAVNDPYPSDSFSTMPPRLLQRLPALPESIDYRFVGRALVLIDTSATLVIDYLPDTVPLRR